MPIIFSRKFDDVNSNSEIELENSVDTHRL